MPEEIRQMSVKQEDWTMRVTLGFPIPPLGPLFLSLDWRAGNLFTVYEVKGPCGREGPLQILSL